MMPSLARMRLATASSRRSSANGSGMGDAPYCGGRIGEERIANRSSEQRPHLLAVRASRASDFGEEVGEFFLDLARELGARARDPGKILEPLERAAGIDDGARIGRARFVEQRIERAAPGTAHEIDVDGRAGARAHRP